MRIEARLHDLAQHVCHLLDCSEANLFLGCDDGSLRHPLLNFLSPLTSNHTVWCDNPMVVSLLKNERMYALCDMAVQTGLVWCSHSVEWQVEGSIAVIPLEQPAGTLGILICIDTRPEAFLAGECHLVEQYLPAIAQQVEEILSDACIVYDPDAVEVDMVARQSEFISLVSHELRTPLTAIKGYAGLLQAYGVSDARSPNNITITESRQKQYINIIMEQARHLEVLISDLLDISRIQSGRLALRYTWVDIAQLCQRVAQLMQCQVDQRQTGQYQIDWSIEPELPLVWADPDRVQQVLINLVENAIKYSPDGGLIEILASTNQKFSSLSEQANVHDLFVPLMSCVAVRDQGVGIPLQQQSSLFKPFTRLEDPETKHVTGVGLGLYISRKLIQAMKGEITLKSVERGGTCVTFTLPTQHVHQYDASFCNPCEIQHSLL